MKMFFLVCTITADEIDRLLRAQRSPKAEKRVTISVIRGIIKVNYKAENYTGY